jgi:RNA polymerase sigma factor (sigma-70 family)
VGEAVQGEQVGTGAAMMTTREGATDCALVAAVRAGEDAAFEELYRRYSRRISTFVYRFVRDEGRAEDVTQEAFLSALRRMRQTDSEIAFRPWIYEIARNAAIDLHRRTSRAEEVSINGDAPLHPGDRSRLVGSAAPENALVDKERLENLQGALDELSDTHHRILVLRELEGRSYREIGESMDLTAPAVESTLFRARRRLEKEYSELDTGRRCASMRSVIAQLAEGVDLPRERRKLERHAVRCSACRKRARELGIEPLSAVRIASRAAALLPLPALLRRRGPRVTDAGSRLADGGALAQAAGPALEGTGALVAKAGVLLAAAVLAGGGGATLGGVGPLAPDAGTREGLGAKPAPASTPARKGARRPGRKSAARRSGQLPPARRGAPVAPASGPQSELAAPPTTGAREPPRSSNQQQLGGNGLQAVPPLDLPPGSGELQGEPSGPLAEYLSVPPPSQPPPEPQAPQAPDAPHESGEGHAELVVPIPHESSNENPRRSPNGHGQGSSDK